MMRLKSEDDILKQENRVKIINEIEATENTQRKLEAFRRWQVYKDKTSNFVTDLLLQQFSLETVREMSYSITNISIVRKIINKLSRVYMDGVTRSIDDDEAATENLSELEDKLNINQKMKTQNRMTKLQKNSICYVKPCPFTDSDGNEKMRVRLSPMNPYLYDVIEDDNDRTRPLVYILNNFDNTDNIYTTLDPARVRTTTGAGVTPQAGQDNFGNKRDETIADKKADEGEPDSDNKQYVWWSGKYHFTTNKKGIIVDDKNLPLADGDNISNPIGVIPIVNFSTDQDNSFWSEGGDDLIDAGIVINSMTTQINHIGVVQGYGQFFITGNNLPRNITTGPNKSIILEYNTEDGDPEPTLGFATANPPLRELMQNVESLVALTLTTNDLSTSGVSAKLEGGVAHPSAIALMVDKAESQEDVKDQRQMFIDGEKQIWPIVGKWLQLFSEDNVLDPECIDLLLPEDFDLTLSFSASEVISTEAEKLDNLTKRKALGINTMVELAMLDNPDLDKDTAAAKIDEVNAEHKSRIDGMIITEGGDDDKDKENPLNKE